ncbi:MAG: N-6 DNA methylase [Gammaproteobacteria bacterium]|nr:N-6 DNA methylase [Gammaproteobacteria bacterium]
MKDLDPEKAASKLGKNSGILAFALNQFKHKEAREELRVGLGLLERSLTALDTQTFLAAKPEMWLYFYEDFLAAYDRTLRNKYGVYYTPKEVVELQVRLVGELLESHFSKKLSFADDGVVFLDPAVGTGTYPVAAVKHGLAKVRARYGKGAVPARASQIARNMFGFEILIGPYAVAHLRLTQALESEGAQLNDRLKIYLADTLASPHRSPPGGLTLEFKEVTKEHEAARKVKSSSEVLVCLGNPPYDRDQRDLESTEKRKGGWVRHGDQIEGGAKPEKQGEVPILDDFLAPARSAGKGLNLQVIFNDYVYFWRWALWRLFEQQKCGGIVSFITAASYLIGPGFVGVREVMRRTFDELWILDLGGDNLGARKTPNVFAIQIPVVIAIGVRGKKKDWDSPARVHYARLDRPTRAEKLEAIDSIEGFGGIEWTECSSDWQAPFFPPGRGAYFEWPELTDLFPFHTAGSVFYRAWPISESKDVLQARWDTLIASTQKKRKELFVETRDRKITHTVKKQESPGFGEPSVSEATTKNNRPTCIRYGYRSFDRQYALFDARLGDFIRPAMVRLSSEHQVFLVSPNSMVPGSGPVIAVSADVPDQHFFRGSFGGRDVIPLYRNPENFEPNISKELLNILGEEYGERPNPADLAGYVYALLGGQSYAQRFWHELEIPGARIPVTKKAELFAKASSLGRRLMWLQTYAKRFRGEERGDSVPVGQAQWVSPMPDDSDSFPEEFIWDSQTETIKVGTGQVAPVPREIWEFEVSGLKVVESWLGYRMKTRAGKKSSSLDKMRPMRWTARMSEEFQELLWVLEATLAMEPELERVLDDVVASPCFNSSELPQPEPEQRKAPAPLGDQGQLLNDVT